MLKVLFEKGRITRECRAWDNLSGKGQAKGPLKVHIFLRLRISLCCSVQADKWMRFYQNAYWCIGLTYCSGLNGGRKAGSQYDLHSFTSSNRGSSSKVCPIENNTNLDSIYYLVKVQKLLLFFYLNLTWLLAHDITKEFWKNSHFENMYDIWFSS